MTNFRADNARDKSLQEIVRGYVKPPELDQINDWWANVILGPRGTGKTTILKVLSTGGARAFKAQGLQVPHEVRFVGAYVPADDHWSRATADLAEVDQEHLYRLLVCRSSVVTVQDLATDPELFGSPPWSVSAQQETAVEIAKGLGLSSSYSSLLAIADRIDREIDDAARGINRDQDSSRLRSATGGLGLTAAAELVFKPARRVAGPSMRWVLLLDELELATEAVYSAVWRELRNPGDLVRLKVALLAGGEFRSPGLQATDMPQPGHDYTPFRLGADRQGYVRFATRLGERLLETHSVGMDVPLSLRDILGPDVLGRPRPNVGKAGELTPLTRRVFDMSALAERDEGFRTWFEDGRQVDDQLARKISTMVRFRHDYNRAAGGGQRRRTLELYCGFPNFFGTSEGNPRRVTWLMNELVAYMAHAEKRRVRISDQAAILNKVVARQVDVLGAMRPGSSPTAPSLLELVDALGHFFRLVSLESSFREDPVSTFEVRSGDPSIIHELVELGLQWGGFVETRRSGIGADATMITRFVRLDALMAVRHRLPLKIGKSRRVVNIPDVERLLDSRAGLRDVAFRPSQLVLWEPER